MTWPNNVAACFVSCFPAARPMRRFTRLVLTVLSFAITISCTSLTQGDVRPAANSCPAGTMKLSTEVKLAPPEPLQVAVAPIQHVLVERMPHQPAPLAPTSHASHILNCAAPPNPQSPGENVGDTADHVVDAMKELIKVFVNVSAKKGMPDKNDPKGIPAAVMQLVLYTAVILIGLGLFAMIASAVIQPRDGFVFRHHWGGFGGESSGWNISAPLARFAVGLLLLSLGALMALELLSRSASVQVADDAPAEISPESAPARDKPATTPADLTVQTQ
jgi:hypothetical protein